MTSNESGGSLSGWIVAAAWLLTFVAGYFGIGEFLSRLVEGILPGQISKPLIVIPVAGLDRLPRPHRRLGAPARRRCRGRSGRRGAAIGPSPLPGRGGREPGRAAGRGRRQLRAPLSLDHRDQADGRRGDAHRGPEPAGGVEGLPYPGVPAARAHRGAHLRHLARIDQDPRREGWRGDRPAPDRAGRQLLRHRARLRGGGLGAAPRPGDEGLPGPDVHRHQVLHAARTPARRERVSASTWTRSRRA